MIFQYDRPQPSDSWASCLTFCRMENDRSILVAVYEYPDYVQLMSYPFTLSVACTTSLQDEIVRAAKSGFCQSSSGDRCVFQFVASCFDDNQVSSSSSIRTQTNQSFSQKIATYKTRSPAVAKIADRTGCR